MPSPSLYTTQLQKKLNKERLSIQHQISQANTMQENIENHTTPNDESKAKSKSDSNSDLNAIRSYSSLNNKEIQSQPQSLPEKVASRSSIQPPRRHNDIDRRSKLTTNNNNDVEAAKPIQTESVYDTEESHDENGNDNDDDDDDDDDDSLVI